MYRSMCWSMYRAYTCTMCAPCIGAYTCTLCAPSILLQVTKFFKDIYMSKSSDKDVEILSKLTPVLKVSLRLRVSGSGLGPRLG